MFEFAIAAAVGWIAVVAVVCAGGIFFAWLFGDPGLSKNSKTAAFITVPLAGFTGLAVAARVFEALQ